MHGQHTLAPKTGRSSVCRMLSGRVDIVTSSCRVVRWRVLTLSTSFVEKVGQCFLRGGTIAEFLDETGVSLRGWIATNDSRGRDTGYERTVEGASVTVSQNMEYSGESGNAMSVSALASRSGTHDGIVHVGSWENSNPSNTVREGGRPRFLKEMSCATKLASLFKGGLPPMTTEGLTPESSLQWKVPA